MEDADPELMAAAARLVKTLGNKIIQNLGVPGYNVVINNGAVAGQVVPHLHWHLIPRQFNDGLKPWPAAQDYAVGEMEEVLSKLRTN